MSPPLVFANATTAVQITEAVQATQTAGTIVISNNKFDFPTSNYTIMLGTYSNSANITISHNTFAGNGNLTSAGISVQRMASGKTLQILHNYFIGVSVNTLNIKNSDASSNVQILFNYFDSNSPYKVSSAGSATPYYEGNYYATAQTTATSDYNIIQSLDAMEEAYRIWLLPSQDLTLNLNGGTLENIPTYYKVGAGLTLPVPERVGFEFLGWYTTEDFSGDAVTIISKEETEAKVFYANWKALGKTIIFDTDGGSSVDAIVGQPGESVVAPANPTKGGKNFVGWDGNDDGIADELPTVIPETDTIYKALWSDKKQEVGAGKDYSTIAEAVQYAKAGDTITIFAGTYNENIVIDKSITLLGANAGIAYNGTRNDETIITSIKITASEVIIDGVKLTATQAIEVTTANNITIKNSIMGGRPTANTQQTVLISGNVDGFYFLDSLVEQNNSGLTFSHYRAIHANGGTVKNVIITGSKFINHCATSVYIDGIKLTKIAGNIVIENNSFDWPGDNFTVYLGSSSIAANTVVNFNYNLFDGTVAQSGTSVRNIVSSATVNMVGNVFNNVKGTVLEVRGSSASDRTQSPVVQINNNAFVGTSTKISLCINNSNVELDGNYLFQNVAWSNNTATLTNAAASKDAALEDLVSYSVSYELGKGKVNVPLLNKYFEGYKLDLSYIIPVRVDGYEFLGWYDNPEFTGEAIKVLGTQNKNLVLYAKYNVPEYTITFKVEGETISEQTFSIDDKDINVPDIPEKAGFIGVWESYELNDNDVVVNAIYHEKGYSTSFDSTEGFEASTTYNNTEEIAFGPEAKQWKSYFGTASTTGPISTQSMQMRWYTKTPESLGYIYSDFTIYGVNTISFKAMNTNGLNVTVSYSLDEGKTWQGEQLFELTSNALEYIYVIDQNNAQNVRIKFQVTLPNASVADKSRLVIDDVVASFMTQEERETIEANKAFDQISLEDKYISDFTLPSIQGITWSVSNTSCAVLNGNDVTVTLPQAGQADELVTFTATFTINGNEYSKEYQITIPAAEEMAEPEKVNATISELKALTDEMKAAYYLTGQVTSITNTTFGNIYVKDESGESIYVYGTTASTNALVWNGILGEYAYNNPKDYSSNNLTKSILIGDTVSLLVVRTSYEGTPQLKAVLLSVTPHEHEYSEGKCTYCQQSDPNYVEPETGFGVADLTTMQLNTSYVSSTSTSGWKAQNAAIVNGATYPFMGSATAAVLNGKTTAVGNLTSPTLTGGVTKISFSYGLPFTDTKIDFTIIVTDLSNSETYEYTVSNLSATKGTAYSDSFVLSTPILGDFTIKFSNNSPSNSTSNKDRTAIWDIKWYTDNAVEHEHEYVNGECACGEKDPNYVVPEPTESWTLVTDASELQVGDQIVIVANGSAVALSTNQKTSNRGQATVTKTNNTIVLGADVQTVTLEAGKVADTFAFYTGDGYLYAASSSSNHLKTQTTLDDNGSWSISINASGIATIKAQGSNTRNWLRYNSSSSLFACYASGQADISIYKLSK